MKYKKYLTEKNDDEYDYLKLDYSEQLLLKQKFINNLFRGFYVEDIIGMEEPKHYRHKIYATFGKNNKSQTILGMYKPHTHHLINSDDSIIQHELGNKILTSILEIVRKLHIEPYNEDLRMGILRHVYLRISYSTGRVMLVLVIAQKELPGSKKLIKLLLEKYPEIETIILNYNNRKTSVVLGEKEKVIYGRGYIIDELFGIKFKISSKSFYQVNPLQTIKLYAKAMELAQLKKDDCVLDACCGIGTITLVAAKSCKYAVGVEVVKQAIEDANNNAKINNIDNVSFYCADIKDFMQHNRYKFDVVLLDPPRMGLNENFLFSLIMAKPKKIVYISCNPITQKRDIKILMAKGYEINEIVPIDLFPYTEHVECVVLMSKVQK